MQITPPSQREKQRERGGQNSERADTIPLHNKLIKYAYKICMLLLSGFHETLTL
jgi:hypothetical protein